MKKLLTNNFLLLAALVIITSCSKKAGTSFHSRSPEHGLSVKVSPEAPPSSDMLEASTVSAPVVFRQLPAMDQTTEEKVISPANADTRANKKLIEVRSNNKAKDNPKVSKVKILKELTRGDMKESAQRTGVGTLLLVIFAIILPPLAVVLVDGLGGPFWLSILLTLLFYVPGLIYALYRVFRAEG
ncbi:MAG TPA: YqaE/Pmp3 family membrane protein [Cytophagaceae bacterium]